MERNYTKDYIEISNQFRKSNADKESVEKLYDLYYELEKIERTKSDDLILSNIYSLLGFHQSAYEVFQAAADLTDRKSVAKLYVMEEKAKSHKNNFIIKDIRKYRDRKEQIRLDLTDFIRSAADEVKYEILNKNLVVFNKTLKDGKIEIYLPDRPVEIYADRIIKYIVWLSDCKSELIHFYNHQNNSCAEGQADEDWYDTLEIFSVRVTIGQSTDIFADISVGDDLSPDHILDIETTNQTITAMSYDG
ncbi:hypothetical protein [Pedobacter caeni]|uniref:Uncharacterized protein n=1 Tax=Pedobacter caeni TaxID=288992 RepID=A0A1M5A283_9SPHI|nr:hypothetical protein [Pedobacter caeni]SHF24388.1 hypothetical protein SAMN04488522_102556 [Pedobacter caeni]